MNYGYARVSTKAQHEDRQIIALIEAGVDETMIFVDKQSGKDFNRFMYKRLIRRIEEGDVLFIKSIDRLGRNYDEIIDEWRKLTKEKNCDIVVLDMPLLDTRGSKDLTGTLISDLVLQILSYVAEKEREMIKQRQAEGIAAARQRGVRFGRPQRKKPDNYEEVSGAWKAGTLSARKAAKVLGVAHSTFLGWVNEKEGVKSDC